MSLNTYQGPETENSNLCCENEDFVDQYQYLGNCPPSPPLTQH